jgi:hypothetical protein
MAYHLFRKLMEDMFCFAMKLSPYFAFPVEIMLFKNSSHGSIAHVFILCLHLKEKPKKPKKKKKMGK